MKKFLALLLSMILVLSLAACGGGSGQSQPADDSKPTGSQPADSGSEPAGDKTVKVGLICIGD